MGCGKSCIGKELAAQSKCKLIDLDSYIEENTGRRIDEIFANEGEAGFRQIETSALKEIIGIAHTSDTPDLILALGGGTLTTPEAAGYIHDYTVCTYLEASVDTLVYNLTEWPGERPLLRGCNDKDTLRNRVQTLLEARRKIYEANAHIIVNVDNSDYKETARYILERCIR